MSYSNMEKVFEFISAVLTELILTPSPPNSPKLHSFEARWCAERVVCCSDLEEFEHWLDARGDLIERYTDVTHQFVCEHKMKRGPLSGGVY
jgi:hypothetical protein